MEKLVLIDGNSLLNRAFYAIRTFSTKDGLPTNGIFGFVKLLFKIIEDEHPELLVIAFDLHAPTFRHKMYADYKGTRKPMPEELVRQVEPLKELLRAMHICIAEKEGYEADDIIGTLSRAFPDKDVLIYTGDRDAYQLVREHVTVCFTKRGVSELGRLTPENFVQEVGLTPDQIVDGKALMGDHSDNIPGVRGIGIKCSLELLQKYGTLENIYAHLSELRPSVRSKLQSGKELALLSRTLATIDTAVPLDVSEEDCRLHLPFPQEARAAFLRLEFRSLIDPAIFAGDASAPDGPGKIEKVVCNDPSALPEGCTEEKLVALVFGADALHIAVRGREYLYPIKQDLLDGFFPEQLKPVLERLLTGQTALVTADCKQLLHRAAALGITPSAPIEDVLLLRYLNDSNRRPSTCEQLANEFGCPTDCLASALFFAYDEACSCAAGTAEETLYRTLELPLSHVLFDMEQTGVRVDISRFDEFSNKYRAELEELSKRIYALADSEPFNLNSTFRLSEILFDKLGYSTKGVKKNNRGGYSTSAEVLEKLAEEHEIARLILRYREIQKLQSTYIDGIRPLVDRDGIVHTTYNQMATTTGRLSSANPNLQNIPVRRENGRELRKLFIPREGNIFVDADYSQIELRLLAHFSQCPALVDAYKHGKDIHAATASQVFGVPQAEVTPAMRRSAKAVNFGIIYGISAFGLAKDLGITAPEAQRYIDKYFEMYPEVKEYMQENVRRAKQDGYVTTILGRKRIIPELKSSNFNLRVFGERAAMNMPLQGSAADIIKIAMLNVFERLRREGLRAKLVLQVHDELVIDVPQDEAERVTLLLREEMEHAVALRVPLTVELTTGVNWYEAK